VAMLNYEVRRTITINQPCATIIGYLSDFRNWPEWSPWLVLEPDCPTQFEGIQGDVGASYQWNGKLIGAGTMTLIEKDVDSLNMALEFLSPFKSKADVNFEVVQTNNSSVVTWSMKSKLPWLFFFMKNMMKALIGMDFDRGLLMLKSQMETDAIPSLPTVIGERHQPKIHYIALKGRATIPELSDVMKKQFTRLNAFCETHHLSINGPPFVLYENMDKTTTESEFFSCFPIENPIEVEPPFVCDTLEECETFVVQHKGAYRFMGNAWSLAMIATRTLKIKIESGPMGIERYINSPNDVEDAELITEIILLKK
jgi:hypothetical protein